MNNKNDVIQDRSLEKLITDFCEIILIKGDGINFNKGTFYIKSLTSTEKSSLNSAKEEDSCSVVRNIIMEYIQTYQSEDFTTQPISSPFEFDSADNFKKYIKHFECTYKENNEQNKISEVFSYAFSYIQEMSDHYRIFEQFYKIRSQETCARILSDTKEAARTQALEASKEAVEEGTKEAAEKAAQKAAKEATALAEKQANNAAMSAETAAQKAQDAAESAVELAVKSKMSEVTQKMSETSVTILGIFSGIVLTVVAGLFYSSSVLENINAANFYRLVCVAALVGLVCFNLISVMFLYIERIRDSAKKEIFRFDKITLFANITLIIIVVVFGILQFFIPVDNNTNGQAKTQEASSKTIEITGTINNVQHETLTENETDNKKE